MEEKVKVDAIVVGGGPAGLSAAFTMAKAGLEVVLIERGEFSGSKNLGGLLYGTILNEMIPNFWEQAPIERSVVKRQITYLGQGEHACLTFGADKWGQPPHNYTYTVHRSAFDRWFAQQAEAAGASLVEGMLVDDLIYEGEGAAKKAVGVKLRGDEEFYANAIILCDGANCRLSDKVRATLGLGEGRHEQDFALGVKETIALPKQVIEDRFGLEDGQGAACDYIGIPFAGLVGGGFIYTQKETISIGVAAKLATVEKSGLKPNEIMEKFRQHPQVRPLVRGGELQEYGAHLIPEGGYNALGQLVGNGVLIAGDAGGFVNMSLYKEGTNHAMETGRLAAQTVIEAKQKGDFSHATLQAYEQRLANSLAMQDLEKYRHLPEILDSTPEVLSTYPAKATHLMVEYFTVSREPKAVIQKRAIKNFLGDLPKLKFAMDMFKARRLM